MSLPYRNNKPSQNGTIPKSLEVAAYSNFTTTIVV